MLDPKSSPNPAKRKLFPARGGDSKFWKANPQVMEQAQVLTKAQKGREVIILMTKARNQEFGARFERTGTVFKEEAIVIQGFAIDRLSTLDISVPANVVANASVIRFGK